MVMVLTTLVMVILVVLLTFCIVKMISKREEEEDTESILQNFNENEFQNHCDNLDSEGSIFVIDDDTRSDREAHLTLPKPIDEAFKEDCDSNLILERIKYI